MATNIPANTEMIETIFLFKLRKRMQYTAAAVEPDETPMISGLANGLLRRVWKIFPATPKAIPQSIAVIVLGNLSFAIIYEPSSLSPRIVFIT